MRAVVPCPVLPLLLRPEEDGERSDELLLGMEAEVLDTPRPGWLRVRTPYRYTGFVPAHRLLRGRSANPWARRPKAVVSRALCDVLSAPGLQAPLLLSLTRGALLSPTGAPEEGWQGTLLPGGRLGYVRADSLAPWPPPPVREEQALRRQLADTALSYLGAPYRWGGKTPLGIDCSGLVSMAYLLNGVVICRDARLEPGFPVRPVPFPALGVGDLLYFPGHVAMYLGNGQFIHATARDGAVAVGSLEPDGPGYRPDLAGQITACGTIF